LGVPFAQHLLVEFADACLGQSLHKDDSLRHAVTGEVAASYSAPGVLAEAAHKTGRAKADFELREISGEEYNKVNGFI
jgi:hypothetical protein